MRRGQLKFDGTRAETRFRLSAKRTSPFKSAGRSVQSTTGSRGVCISGNSAGYTMFRGSVKGTCYPLLSPVSFSLLPCVAVCHHISTGVYMYVVYVDVVVIIEMGQGINEVKTSYLNPGRCDETIGGDSWERPKTDSSWCLWYARCWIFRSCYRVVSFLISFKNKQYVFGLFWVQGF